MRSITYALMLATALFSLQPATAGELPSDTPSFPLECALRDAQFVTELERHGEAQDMSGDALYAAFLTMLQARSACGDGKSNEAFVLYDSVFGPTLAHRPQ